MDCGRGEVLVIGYLGEEMTIGMIEWSGWLHLESDSILIPFFS